MLQCSKAWEWTKRMSEMKRTVVITGASSGIGEAFARRFAAEGFDLVLTARRTDRLEALKHELSDTDVHIIYTDLSTQAGIDQLCEEISNTEIEIDILVNNAAVTTPGPFEDLSAEDITHCVTLNMTAVTLLTHRFLPRMIARRSGRVLNVASVAAFHPVPGMHLYAATKAFVLSLSESLSEHLKGTGVSVTALCPGMTNTEGLDPGIAGAVPPQLIADPSEVADEGFDAVMKKEVIRVPGNFNRMGIALAQHQPRWLIRSLGGLAEKLSRS